jgi:hypothetical protein
MHTNKMILLLGKKHDVIADEQHKMLIPHAIIITTKYASNPK